MHIQDTDTVVLEFHKRCVDLFSDPALLCQGSRVMHLNGGALSLLGIKAPDMCVGFSFADIFSQTNRPFFAEDFSSLACGTPIATEMKRGDGSLLDVELRICILNAHNQKSDALFVVFVREISAKMHAIRQLCAHNSRWRSLVEESESAFCIVSSGLIESANPSAARLLGHEHPCSLSGTSFASCLHEESQDIPRYGLERLSQHTESVRARIVTEDGCPGTVDLRVVALNEPDSFMIEMRGIGCDVEKTYEAEQKGRELASILDSVADGMLGVDASGRIFFSNRSASVLFGLSQEEIYNLHVWALIPQLSKESWETCMEAPWLFGQPREVSGRHPDGVLFPLEVTVNTLSRAPEETVFTLMLRDVTDRRKAEQADLRYVSDLEKQVQSYTCEIRDLHHRTQDLLNFSSDAIFGINMDGRISFANPVAESIFRYPSGSLSGCLAEDVFVYGDGPKRGRGILARAALRRGLFHEKTEVVLRRGDGTSFTAEYSSRPLEEGASITGAVVVLRDISRRKLVEGHLEIAAKVLETTTESILVCDSGGTILFANPAASFFLGESIIIGHRVMDAFFAGNESLWGVTLDGLSSTGHHRHEFWSMRKNGDRFAAVLSASALNRADGQLDRIILIVSDITQRKQQEEHALRQANHDALTGLPNRNLFNDRLEHIIKLIGRTDGSIALMFIDLDGFKRVNDDFGHGTGDLLLKEVSARLMGCVRDSDTVARIGGDEFTVILSSVDGEEGASHVARQILASVSALYTLKAADREVQIDDISASIGIVILSGRQVTTESFLKRADEAMYKAKQSGKNAFAFWGEDAAEQAPSQEEGTFVSAR